MSKTFQTILVPVDFSPYAREALQYAASIADHFASSLIVLHAISHEVQQGVTKYHLGQRGLPLLGPYADAVEVPTDVVDTVTIDLRERARTALQHFMPSDLTQQPMDLRIVVGHPASQILETAAHDKADLIVMGTHGRTGLAHLVLGSVAERVLREAPCPVLTVKATAA